MHRRFQACFATALLVSGLFVAGCATPPPADDPDAVADFKQTNDPLEPGNRVTYAINDGLDRAIIRPVAEGYNYVLAPGVRSGIHNLLDNIGNPVVLMNDIAQGKPKRAGDTLMRLVLNTTLGVGGFFDVATGWGWPSHNADLGMTFAVWGLPDGPFLMLPIFGPSNPRDGLGMAGDMMAAPTGYLPKGLENTVFSYSKTALGAIDGRAGYIGQLDRINAQALDPYATIRSLWRQNRQSQIDEAKKPETLTPPAAWSHSK